MKSFEPLDYYLYHLPWEGRGLLLRRSNSNRSPAFSCLPSWPSLGDPSVESLIENFSQHREHPLVINALRNLELDRRARSESRSLLKGRPLTSHWQISPSIPTLDESYFADLVRQGFRSLKIKVNLAEGGRFVDLLRRWTPQLSGLKLRLDCNARTGIEEVTSFLKALPSESLDAIEFIEDPAPYSDDWQRLAQSFRIHLAADFEKPARPPRRDCENFDVLILKPARDSLEEWIDYAHAHLKRVVFSSYLQHPLGQAFDYYHASLWTEAHPLLIDDAGFLNEHCASPDPFDRCGPLFWRASEDLGIGFSDHLASLQWERLRT